MNGAPAGVSRTVDEVTLSEVYDAANQIIYTNPGDIPARFAFTMERVDSKEQLALAANVKVEWFSGSIAASLKFSRDREYNRFLVKLTQPSRSTRSPSSCRPGTARCSRKTSRRMSWRNMWGLATPRPSSPR